MLAPSVMSPLFALDSMDADREDIEIAMREAVVTPDSYLNEIASHLIVAGGKRLRPVARRRRRPGARRGRRPYDVVRGGVSCELVHLGSLYHDDVMDEADTRRGVETVNAKWGNLQAILAGDFLLARASEIAASLGTEVAGLLARTIGWLCEGQIEELRHTYDITRTEESYFASIHGKTASLYGTAARIGGIVAGHDRVVDRRAHRVRQRLRHRVPDRRRHLGRHRHRRTARQAGRPRHDRRRVHAAGAAHVGARQRGGRPTSPSCSAHRSISTSATRPWRIVRSNAGVASAIATAREYVARAEAACDDFPDSAATTALRAAPAALLESVSVHA